MKSFFLHVTTHGDDVVLQLLHDPHLREERRIHLHPEAVTGLVAHLLTALDAVAKARRAGAVTASKKRDALQRRGRRLAKALLAKLPKKRKK